MSLKCSTATLLAAACLRAAWPKVQTRQTRANLQKHCDAYRDAAQQLHQVLHCRLPRSALTPAAAWLRQLRGGAPFIQPASACISKGKRKRGSLPAAIQTLDPMLPWSAAVFMPTASWYGCRCCLGQLNPMPVALRNYAAATDAGPVVHPALKPTLQAGLKHITMEEAAGLVCLPPRTGGTGKAMRKVPRCILAIECHSSA